MKIKPRPIRKKDRVHLPILSASHTLFSLSFLTTLQWFLKFIFFPWHTWIVMRPILFYDGLQFRSHLKRHYWTDRLAWLWSKVTFTSHKRALSEPSPVCFCVLVLFDRVENANAPGFPVWKREERGSDLKKEALKVTFELTQIFSLFSSEWKCSFCIFPPSPHISAFVCHQTKSSSTPAFTTKCASE